GEIYDRLPPCRDVRNPAVQRAMTEVRKLVNAIVREYRKPTLVRIELARDLKKSRKQRKEIWERKEERDRQRKSEARKFRLNMSGREPFPSDIDKAMLAVECGWVCPYTGRCISYHTLFEEPEFQVEHILPLSRFPDDSFNNKTLCHVDANHLKDNRTPYEAFYRPDDPAWDGIIARVRAFPIRNPEKLRRFLLTP